MYVQYNVRWSVHATTTWKIAWCVQPHACVCIKKKKNSMKRSAHVLCIQLIFLDRDAVLVQLQRGLLSVYILYAALVCMALYVWMCVYVSAHHEDESLCSAKHRCSAAHMLWHQVKTGRVKRSKKTTQSRMKDAGSNTIQYTHNTHSYTYAHTHLS